MRENKTNDMIEKLSTEKECKFISLGSLALANILNEVGIDQFFKSQGPEFNQNSSNILKLIIYSKLLFPYVSKINYFECMEDFNNSDVYKFVEILPSVNEDLISYINTQLVGKFNRDTSDIVCLKTDDVLIIIDNDKIPLYYMEREGTTKADIQELLMEFELIYDEDDIKIKKASPFINSLFDSSIRNEDVYDCKDKFLSYYLISYIALVLLKILEKKLNYKYSVEKITESLTKSVLLSYDKQNYKVLYCDEILLAIQKLMDIPYNKDSLKADEIDKLSAFFSIF